MSVAKKIVESDKKRINVIGVPGSGKTQLIHDVAVLAPEKKVLYLSFGHENTKNAKRRMPKNVTCVSFHALARRHLLINSNRIISNFGMSEANAYFKLIDIKPEAKLLQSFVTLNNLFCMSGFRIKHIHRLMAKFKDSFSNLTKEQQVLISSAYIKYWTQLWEDNSGKNAPPVTHDMYFKAYTQCASALPFDYIVIDEVQDLNDAMFDLAERFSLVAPEQTVIKLGDPCQQIFTFRGASNQFTQEEFDYSLDESHRFGKKLCELTNLFMASQRAPYYTEIKSKSDHTSIHDAVSIPELTSSIKQGSLRPTVIARYNVTLWYMLKNLAKSGISCAINGSWQAELSFLQDLHQLFIGNKINKAPFLGMTYKRYSQQVRANNDNGGQLACRFVESIKGDGRSDFDSLRKHLTTPAKAQVLLTTVHQAKGLEFNHLVMMDDFGKCYDQETGKFTPLKRDEAHIVYTAMTRAKYSLTIPRSWKRKTR